MAGWEEISILSSYPLIQGWMGRDKCARAALPRFLKDSAQHRPDWVHLSRRPRRGEYKLHVAQQDLWALHNARNERPARQVAHVTDQKWSLLCFSRWPDLCSRFSFWSGERELYNICRFLHQLWEWDRSFYLFIILSSYYFILLSSYPLILLSSYPPQAFSLPSLSRTQRSLTSLDFRSTTVPGLKSKTNWIPSESHSDTQSRRWIQFDFKPIDIISWIKNNLTTTLGRIYLQLQRSASFGTLKHSTGPLMAAFSINS